MINVETNYWSLCTFRYKILSIVLAVVSCSLSIFFISFDGKLSTIQRYGYKFRNEPVLDDWHKYTTWTFGLRVAFISSFIFVQMASACDLFSKKKIFKYMFYIHSFGEFLIVLVLLLAREILIGLKFSCINDINLNRVYFKAILTISFMVVVLFKYFVNYEIFKRESLDKREPETSLEAMFKKMLVVVFVCYVMLAVGVAGLNINLVVKSHNNAALRTKLSDVKIVLFKNSDIEKLKNGFLPKSPTYDNRTLTQLDKVISGASRHFYVSGCKGKYCIKYYRTRVNIDIKCHNELKRIYSDCNSGNTIRFALEYNEYYGLYPAYECAIISEENCYHSCPSFETGPYKPVLVQENGDNIELAWKDLSNCDQINDVILKQDKTINSCFSSALMQKANIQFLITILVFNFVFYFRKYL